MLKALSALAIIAAVTFYTWPRYDTGYYDSNVKYDDYTYTGGFEHSKQ